MKHKQIFTISRTAVSIMMLSALLLLATVVPASAASSAATYLLSLRFNGLEDLEPGWVYEGWLLVDGAPVSTGRFTVDENGNQSASNFAVETNPKSTTAFVLTIEPEPDPDPGPSQVHILGGSFFYRYAWLTTRHPAALGNSFIHASGSYILAVPSDPSGNTPNTNGIWWLDPAAGPGASLNLPGLPAGWVYEGWAAGENGPVSTGTFLTGDGADSDAGGPAAGPAATPPFPGQDFVDPPNDLLGQAAVISIEPVPDNSPAPFFLKPLVDKNIEDAAGSQEMANNARSFPTGFAALFPAARYQVTLENLTSGQPLSPPVAATHRYARHLIPNYASPELESLAEDGNQVPLFNLLNGRPGIAQVLDIGRPLTPSGQVVGDFSDQVTFEIVARRGDHFSLVSMLVCSNDGFTALENAALPRHGSQTFYLEGYDAGTEQNTELSGDIVDPCSLLGPAALNGDPNGNNNESVDTNPRERISMHPGISGVGDLIPAHAWQGPVARVTITKLSAEGSELGINNLQAIYLPQLYK